MADITEAQTIDPADPRTWRIKLLPGEFAGELHAALLRRATSLRRIVQRAAAEGGERSAALSAGEIAPKEG
jgi:hypothetical protein